MACGCNDTSLPLVNCNDGCDDCPPTNLVNLPDCPQGSEPCEELVYSECTIYKGPNLPALGINNLDRFITVLTKLHKLANNWVIDPVIESIDHTLTNTSSSNVPFVVTYLGYGPQYYSTPTASNSGTTVTVGSTTGLEVGMYVEVIAGTGAFLANTFITNIINSTSFTVDQAPPVIDLSGATIFAYGSDHQIFTTSVSYGSSKTIRAFVNSPSIVSGTGTIVN